MCILEYRIKKKTLDGNAKMHLNTKNAYKLINVKNVSDKKKIA